MMQIIQNEKQKAKMVLLNANLIWGITPIFLEVVLQYIDPLQATTLRFGIAVIMLTFVLYLTKGKNAFSFLSVKSVILLGWLDAFGYLAATVGQDITTAGLATLFSSIYVFIVPFVAWKLEGTNISKRIILVGFLSILGIFLISYNGNWTNFANSSINGILILIFSAIMWGFYTVITSKFLGTSKTKGEEVDLLSFTYASLFHTFLALSVFSIINAKPILIIPLEIIPYILYLGLFPTIFALSMWNWAITRLGSVSTSFFQLLQIIIPFVLEFVFFQQFYSAWIYSGIVLILLSSAWMNEEDTDTSTIQVESLTRGDSLPLDTVSRNNPNMNPNQCC